MPQRASQTEGLLERALVERRFVRRLQYGGLAQPCQSGYRRTGGKLYLWKRPAGYRKEAAETVLPISVPSDMIEVRLSLVKW